MEDLQQISEFRAAPELIEKLEKYGIRKEYAPGYILLNEDSFIRSIPIVIKGIIKVIRTEEDGREILLYYLEAGDSCIMSFLGGMHNEKSKVKAVVEKEAIIHFIPLSKVSLFIKEYPQWSDYIFRLYHQRFEELLDMVNAISFKKVDERLLALLERKSQLAESKTLKITHEQLANELGTARVVVSRLLKTLEGQDKVKLERNKITLI